MTAHYIGERVSGTVDHVYPFGAFITLGNGTQAYIHRREIGLDPNPDAQNLLRAGQHVQAMVVSLPIGNRKLEVSIRRILPEPWSPFAAEHAEDTIVSGTVQALHSHGAFVRVATTSL